MENQEVKIQMPKNPICRRCHRKLKNAVSVEQGFGEICYQKHLAENIIKPLIPIKIKKEV